MEGDLVLSLLMREYVYDSELWLPRPIDEVFQFFSEARNLEKITPPWLNFEVLVPGAIVMGVGTLIDYRIRVHSIPIRWRTEIVEWSPPHGFTDVQLSGPYHLWHHHHGFEQRDGGTRCIDRVRYYPRGGALMNWLFVRRDIKTIFKYRSERLVAMFPANAAA